MQGRAAVLIDSIDGSPLVNEGLHDLIAARRRSNVQGSPTSVVLVADGHAEPQQEVRHRRVSRRTGPVQRGAAVLVGRGGQSPSRRSANIN